MREYKLYEIGGCVRDEILGLKSKDIDYVFVFEDINKSVTVDYYYTLMNIILGNEGFEIFLKTPDCYTTRARFPKDHKNKGLTADFVLARKEIGYDSDSRKPKLRIGTLYDDLVRRDFTVNAIAKDEEGNYIDYFDGIQDIEYKILRTPIDPESSFLDDPLRVLRLLRFHITKGFKMEWDTFRASTSEPVLEKLEKVVSKERIREELNKMFEFDTYKTLLLFNDENFTKLKEIIFKDIYLKPTIRNK